MEAVGDGTHHGLRWWLCRLHCGTLLVTVSGEWAEQEVFLQAEVRDGMLVTVQGVVEAEMAAVEVRAARVRRPAQAA